MKETKSKYLRALYKLTEKGKNKTNTSKLAEELDITDASASEAIKKLQKQQLVCRAPYKGFTLSPLGREKAKKLKDNHKTLTDFFNQLKVENPEKEAEKIESKLSKETINKIKQKTVKKE